MHHDVTLGGISKQAEAKMGKCENCPYVDYQYFMDYYGEFDYGHQFVTAALERQLTPFSKGNMDFSRFSEQAAAEAAKVGSLFMNVWMYVVREFEDALDDCSKGCASDQCNADK